MTCGRSIVLSAGTTSRRNSLTKNPLSLPQQSPIDVVSTRTGIFLDVLNNNKTPAGQCISRVVDAILAVENADDSPEILDTHGDDSPQVSC